MVSKINKVVIIVFISTKNVWAYTLSFILLTLTFQGSRLGWEIFEMVTDPINPQYCPYYVTK